MKFRFGAHNFLCLHKMFCLTCVSCVVSFGNVKIFRWVAFSGVVFLLLWHFSTLNLGKSLKSSDA